MNKMRAWNSTLRNSIVASGESMDVLLQILPNIDNNDTKWYRTDQNQSKEGDTLYLCRIQYRNCVCKASLIYWLLYLNYKVAHWSRNNITRIALEGEKQCYRGFGSTITFCGCESMWSPCCCWPGQPCACRRWRTGLRVCWRACWSHPLDPATAACLSKRSAEEGGKMWWN